MYTICLTFLLFFIYSILGWIIESTKCSIDCRKLIDRGFFIGPYCPIYGVAAIFMILILDKYQNDLITLFVLAMVVASVVEYVIGYLMEKLFKARWWDYSERPFNINGRVYLGNALCFGFLGIILIHFINPIITKSLLMISTNIIYIITIICMNILTIDLIVSVIITYKLKKTADMLNRDCSNEFNIKIKDILSKKSFLFKRINLAFPNFNFLPNRFKISKK